MRFYCISARDVRKNRADCVAVMQSCHEFAKNGFDVTLVTPRVFRNSQNCRKSEIWSLYGLEPTFQVIELPTLLWDSAPAKLIQAQKFIAFSFFCLWQRLRRKLTSDTIIWGYCYISFLPAQLLRRIGILKSKMICNASVFVPNQWIHKYRAQNVDGIFLFNNYVRERYINEYGIDPEIIHKAPFPSHFSDIPADSKIESQRLRDEAGLSIQDKLVVYAGKIAPEIGEVKLIIQAAKLLPARRFWLVGVKDEFRAYFEDSLKKAGISNVSFFGFQPFKRFLTFLGAADVLVSYYASADEVSANQRVSAKASAYISARKPVIMADLPSSREQFSEDMVFYVDPDQPDKLAERIEDVFANPDLAKEKAAKCEQFASEHTWENVFAGISSFLYSTVARRTRTNSRMEEPEDQLVRASETPARAIAD